MSTYQKVIYEGKLGSYQKYGQHYQKSKVQFEQDPFTPYQNFLYKRALFGLSVYTEEELMKMHGDKKKRIDKVHKRAQDVLNIWKQSIADKSAMALLSKVFWHSSLIKDCGEKFASDIDTTYISNLEFKDLGISKNQVIDKLINEKILPINFYQLKEAV